MFVHTQVFQRREYLLGSSWIEVLGLGKFIDN